MKTTRSKKGQITLLLLGIVAIILFTLFIGFSYLLTKNVFTLIGAFLVITGAVGFLMGYSPDIGIGMIIGGIVFIMLPFMFSGLSKASLAVILG